MFSSRAQLVYHLLEMPQGQPLSCPPVDENVPILPVPHTATAHLQPAKHHDHMERAQVLVQRRGGWNPFNINR